MSQQSVDTSGVVYLFLFIQNGSNVLKFLYHIRALLLFIFMMYCDSE
jgi:hypothetical protein